MLEFKLHPLVYTPPEKSSRGPKTANRGVNRKERLRRDRIVEEKYVMMLRDNFFFSVQRGHDHDAVGDKEVNTTWLWEPDPDLNYDEDPNIFVHIRRVRGSLAFSVKGSTYKPLCFALLKAALELWDSNIKLKISEEVRNFEKEGLYIQEDKTFKYVAVDRETSQVFLAPQSSDANFNLLVSKSRKQNKTKARRAL